MGAKVEFALGCIALGLFIGLFIGDGISQILRSYVDFKREMFNLRKEKAKYEEEQATVDLRRN